MRRGLLISWIDLVFSLPPTRTLSLLFADSYVTITSQQSDDFSLNINAPVQVIIAKIKRVAEFCYLPAKYLCILFLQLLLAKYTTIVQRRIIIPIKLSLFCFQPYAYSSAPIIIKNAVSHWPAVALLNYTYLKDLYLKTPGALESVHEDCQFLHFKSNFMTLDQVFAMPEARAQMSSPGEQPWYVGWSNCHPGVLAELRKLYPRPHFLPADAEMPNTDFIFLGWEQGAVMNVS